MYASKDHNPMPYHALLTNKTFLTKDEQLLDCSLVFWHSRGPLKVGCQGPPMAFEFNFWGSRYVRRSRFKLPHRLHGVLGFHVKPVATLKVELFHPAFLQGFSPTKRVEKFWWDMRHDSLVIWQVTSKEKLKETIDGIQHKGQPGYLVGTNLVSWLFQLW